MHPSSYYRQFRDKALQPFFYLLRFEVDEHGFEDQGRTRKHRFSGAVTVNCEKNFSLLKKPCYSLFCCV